MVYPWFAQVRGIGIHGIHGIHLNLRSLFAGRADVDNRLARVVEVWGPGRADAHVCALNRGGSLECDAAAVSAQIEVWRSVRVGGNTKTKRSRRTLPLPDDVVTVLREHRERQAVIRARAKAKNRWTESNLVFCTRYGDELTAQSVRRTLAVALRLAALPVEWTPRELRHSFVSLMSAHGAPVELIAHLARGFHGI